MQNVCTMKNKAKQQNACTIYLTITLRQEHIKQIIRKSLTKLTSEVKEQNDEQNKQAEQAKHL